MWGVEQPEDNMTNTQPPSSSLWQILTEINLAGQPGIDQVAWDHVAGVVRSLQLAPADLERLKTAIAETMLKAIKRGRHYRSDLPVSIQLRISYKTLARPTTNHKDMPDLTANTSAQESLRGWGFFLVERMVDDIQIRGKNTHNSIELFLYRE